MKILIALALLVAGTAQAKTIRFTEKNVCTIDETVTPKSMKAAKKCLIRQSKLRGFRRYPLYLVLNTPGGSVYAGLDFIRFAKTIPNLHTYTIFATSMGSAIVEHLPGRRYYDENSIFMFHRAQGTFRGQFGTGEVEQRLKLWTAIVTDMGQKSAKRMGMSFGQYQRRIKDEWWIYGDQSKRHSVADEKVNVICSKKLIQLSTETHKKTLFGTFTFSKSQCPLVGRL